MKKHHKKWCIAIILLSFFLVCFFPRRITLPAYDDAVINITKRESSGDSSITLTEQENKALYTILQNVKGISMPSIFGKYIAHGRTIYEVGIYSKTKGIDVRFTLLFDYDNRPLVSVKNSKHTYQKIINGDDLVDFVQAL